MNEWSIPTPRACVACGKHHRGVNDRLNCLEKHVVKLRGELAVARHVADTFLRALAPGR